MPKRGMNKATIIKVVGVVIAVGLIGLGFKAVKNTMGSKSTGSSIMNSSKDDRVEVANALATTQINRDFYFPLIDGNGTEVSQLKYEVVSAELRNEVIIKGSKANSVEGRQFLIINLKLTNNYEQGIEIDTRDYLRLSLNGEDERLAASIHNDPTEVQPISTKQTRLGFTIDEDATDLKLYIGEIKGEKTEISVNF